MTKLAELATQEFNKTEEQRRAESLARQQANARAEATRQRKLMRAAYLREVAEQADRAAREARRAYNDAVRAAAPFHVGDVAVAIRDYGGYAKNRRQEPCEVKITRTWVTGGRIVYEGRWRNRDGKTWGKVAHDIYSELHPVGWTPPPPDEVEPITSDML